MTKHEVPEIKTEKTCYCPYCDQSMTMPLPFCMACGAVLRFCSQCDEPLPQEATVCPNCGAEVD